MTAPTLSLTSSQVFNSIAESDSRAPPETKAASTPGAWDAPEPSPSSRLYRSVATAAAAAPAAARAAPAVAVAATAATMSDASFSQYRTPNNRPTRFYTLSTQEVKDVLKSVKRAVRKSQRVRLGTMLAVLPNKQHKFHLVLLDTGADSDLFHPSYCVPAPKLPDAIVGNKMAKGLFQQAGAMGDGAYMDLSVGTGFAGRAFGRMLPPEIASQINYSILSFQTGRMLGLFEERLADELFSPAAAPRNRTVENSDKSAHKLRAPLVVMRKETQQDLDAQRRRKPKALYVVRWRDTFGKEQRGANVAYIPDIDYRRTNPQLFDVWGA